MLATALPRRQWVPSPGAPAVLALATGTNCTTAWLGCPPACLPVLPPAVRMTWNVWPHSRLEAAKCVIPFCTLYTPARQTSQLQVAEAD